jgi:ribose transport system ATP-binding protein
VPAALLTMNSIRKRFGATQALRGLSFEARSGEVLALIGENGAGKSTLMKILSGAHSPDSGTMQLAGEPYAPRGPQAARQAGVAMIYQELTLAPHLSVEDNVLLGQESHRFGWLDRTAQRKRLREVLAELGHADLAPTTIVGTLSVGEQQLVEIARALLLDAKVIVFDEPTSSLTQHDAQRLFEVIGRLKASGRAVIYISHFLEEIRRLCDRYTVLRDGESVGSGLLAGTSEAQLVALMAGRSVQELFPTVPHTPGETLLTVNKLTGQRLPRDVSFELRRGEILGIFGLVGSGRTELLRALFALDPIREGSVQVRGKNVPHSPAARLDAGLGFVSEDRKGEGLAQSCSITANTTLSRLAPYRSWGLLRLGERRAAVEQWMKRLQVKARSADQAVSALSGGNQQKVAIARILHQEAEILLLDEPTRGIDVGTKAEIYRLMGESAAQGKAVLFVSSYLPELLAVCDRIGVMARGRLRAVRNSKDWTAEALLTLALSEESSG